MTHLNSALLSRHASPSLLTSSQIALDGFLQNFSSNVTNPTVLLPMMAGTFAFQASRAALISAGMGRLFSSGLAWLAEVGVFHESGRLAARLAGHASSEPHFLRTALDLGVFKLTGSALPRTNFITRNASQAFAMLGAEELAVSANLLERSSESFSSRYAHAFASSVQMEAGALLSGMALGGTLKSLERTLETVSALRSTPTNPMRSLPGRNVLSMATGSTPYDPFTDPRDIPENIRINFKRFRQGVNGLKRYLERIEGGRLREPAPEIMNGEGEVRDSLIPEVSRENEARQAFLIRFLGFARWRGEGLHTSAEEAVRLFNSVNSQESQRGTEEILRISQEILRYFRLPPRLIIGVTGKDASGKDSVLDMLAQQGFRTMSLSDALRAELTRQGKEPSRENCRLLANELRARDGASALARLALSQMEPGVNYAFGSIRNPAEVEALREAGNGNFHFVATTAPAETRFERLRARGRLGDAPTLESFLAHEALEASNSDPNAQQMDRVIGMADRQIDNSGSYGEFQARVANYLRDLLKASQE